MNSLFFKRLVLFVTFVTLFKVGISAQSKSVFLNLKVGQTTYQEAINQINNSKYRNYVKTNEKGSIFVVGTTVEQNDGMIWDHIDIHFSEGYINNIHFHSNTASGHRTDYLVKKYQQRKEFFISNNGYSFWYEENGKLVYKYYGVAVTLKMFDSNVAGKVLDVQYIGL